jgi:choice-of-anchor C domain-containing protein
VRLAIALLVLAAVAGAAPFTNGSFESGPNPGTSFISLGTGVALTPGWITTGPIDYIGPYWQAANGTRSVDLNQTSPGGVSQTFDTVTGLVYRVVFNLAGNPDGGPTVKTLQAAATGNAAQSYSFDTTGATLSNMRWSTQEYRFTATGTSTTLGFTSTTAGSYGPAIDNVQVQPLPEPGTWMLVGLGLITLIARSNRLR